MVLITKLINLVIEVFKMVPSEISSCGGIITEGSEAVNFILHHLSPIQIVSNIAGNLLTHIFPLLTDTWYMAIHLFGFKWFELGKDAGSILMIVIA